MLATLLSSALFMGVLGSLHCAAMCGPLAVGACRSGGSTRVLPALGYFGARLAGYALVGAALGALGLTLRGPVLSVVQSGVVLLAAAVTLARGVQLLISRRSDLIQIAPARRSFTARVAALLPSHGAALGLITAVLPCGQLAAAWALAASAGAPAGGAAVMGLFAVGSAPGLLVPVVGSVMADRFAFRISHRWTGIAWCGIGLLLVGRLLVALLAPGASCHG